eukprot:TRINITY_DN9315_c0_g1_i1.p1 TRINITY_DN9315_c0_g1~~TRINITY_DN9315_c0_g1_i1.p1  ORF type:complete len:445 (-),score=124.72 TRINITY_DN9315_c0_g1_i1:31-1365(-)
MANETDRFFDCPICEEVFKDAVETPCCHKCYCRSCIHSWLAKSGSCPECRAIIQKKEDCKPNLPIQRLISTFPVKCFNHEFGCNASLVRGNLEDHRAHCEYEKVACPLNLLCEHVFKKDLQNHITSECELRPINCPRCATPLEQSIMLEAHNAIDCPFVDVECQACLKILQRVNLDKHVNEECTEQLDHCSFCKYGCTFPPKKREDIKKHIEENTKEHLALLVDVVEQKNTLIESLTNELTQYKGVVVKLKSNLSYSNMNHLPVPQPSRMVSTHAPSLISVENDLEVSYRGQPAVLIRSMPAKMVRSDITIPLIESTFYFEVRVLAPSRGGEIGVGLAVAEHDLDGMPGWTPGSLGYHGDDGRLFHESSGAKGIQFGSPFGKDDVIGLGWDQKKKTVFYTRNGNLIGNALVDFPEKKYYAVVGMHTVSAKAKVNFGSEPFLFKL